MKRSLFFLLLPLLTFAQVRINSGGSQAGQWAADAHFSTSNTFSTAAPIPVTLPERTDTTRRGDTVRIAYYYPTVDTFTQITEIYMPSFYGGRVLVNDSTTLYKALFGVLPPLKTDTDITPRVYRFSYSGFRLTLFKTGAWIRQRRINGQWVDVPY